MDEDTSGIFIHCFYISYLIFPVMFYKGLDKRFNVLLLDLASIELVGGGHRVAIHINALKKGVLVPIQRELKHHPLISPAICFLTHQSFPPPRPNHPHPHHTS